MLAVSDADGNVEGSIPGIAHLAGISIGECETSLKTLMAPDPYSRTKDHEGKRITDVDGGWIILNRAKYRDKKAERTEYMRNYMRKRRQDVNNLVSNVNLTLAQKEKEKEKEKKNTIDFRQNSDEFRLADLLLNLILERKPDYKRQNIQTWANHIDRMIRLDNRKPETIEAVIRWAQADTGDGGKWCGWQDNILSTAKLREQFDKLELGMNKGGDEPGQQEFACRELSEEEADELLKEIY